MSRSDRISDFSSRPSGVDQQSIFVVHQRRRTADRSGDHRDTERLRLHDRDGNTIHGARGVTNRRKRKEVRLG